MSSPSLSHGELELPQQDGIDSDVPEDPARSIPDGFRSGPEMILVALETVTGITTVNGSNVTSYTTAIHYVYTKIS